MCQSLHETKFFGTVFFRGIVKENFCNSCDTLRVIDKILWRNVIRKTRKSNKAENKLISDIHSITLSKKDILKIKMSFLIFD